MFAAQKTIPHQFGQRTHGQPLVEGALDLGIAAFHRVADDDQVGMMIEIRFAKAQQDADAARFQKRGHRRIDVFVAAGDRVAEFAAHRGDGRHRGATNPHKMHPALRGTSAIDLLVQHH